ncbi:MAG: hypothetical protein AB1861_13925 [Cyanobacteriota bacterium]
MTRLIPEEFRDALQKGLGRAILYVREHGMEEVRDDILQACLHNFAYDPQCEKSRANWLLEIVSLTDDEEFYHQRILEALPNSTDFWDAHQLIELAAVLAQLGSKQARRAIYDKFDLQQFNESWFGGCQIVKLDGIEGLLHVAEVIGARLLKEQDSWEDDYLVTEAGERFGFETVMAALEERASTNANIRAYKDAIAKHSESVRTTHRNHQSRQTVNNILFKIEAASGSIPSFYSTFGRRASDEDIEHLFARLLAETRREQLIRYLWVFRRRTLPSLNRYLFELAESDDEELQDAAISAIANTKDKSVRDLAIRLLQEKPTSIYRGAIELFIKNYQPRDCQLIESVLYASENPNMFHALGCDLVNLAKAQGSPELASCCLWVYENTPCSICRKRIVEALLELDQATESLVLECLWDCSQDIRALAKSWF